MSEGPSSVKLAFPNLYVYSEQSAHMKNTEVSCTFVDRMISILMFLLCTKWNDAFKIRLCFLNNQLYAICKSIKS